MSSNMPQHLLEDHSWEDVSSKTWKEINSE